MSQSINLGIIILAAILFLIIVYLLTKKEIEKGFKGKK